ncbi:hypothetical protein Mal52_27440 [Symmachiella dynata]|uniref:Probable inorganic carbon transporter subunit DabA n=1 Tax=Symmachiella dynata TaxID=2527995 RepID=A0A517ZP55_9PLAN|nr:DUF2309 domain-containing protein [Symmachiella dynata]QDU44265.1 hypothetical protein Mal52_27440 [Symmachiella dynata]
MPTLESGDETSAERDQNSVHSQLRHMVEHAAHFLPAQGPIEVFVHHNTLHAFEKQEFHAAVQAGYARYRAEPYLSEQEFRRLYEVGRITDQDLEFAILDDLGEKRNDEINGLGTRAEIRFAMLRHTIQVGPDAELRWIVAETDALDRFREKTTQINRTRIISAATKLLQDADGQENSIVDISSLLSKLSANSSKWTDAERESFSLHLLWRVCLDGIGSFSGKKPNTTSFVRPRDLLLHATGEDIDRDVHDVLIRFCAAYVDQGYSDWILPNREQGFYESFLALYSVQVRGTDRWLRQLPAELKTLIDNKVTAEASIENSLRELGIPLSQREEFITQSLLALGGWAGMIWQLESGVDWVVHSIAKGSLVGMLAVQLILEKYAVRNLGEHVFGSCSSINSILDLARQRIAEPKPLTIERRAFLLFQVAQMLGWTPLELLQLTETEWAELSDEVEGFSAIHRRRVFHEAYERQYRLAALDAFAEYSTRLRQADSTSDSQRPSFQIVTCIDDREESFRRHLEEVEPNCETFGAAGFFATAIYYRGAADGFYKPLCPGVMIPDHYVQEDVGYTFEGVHRERAELRRRLGLASRAFHTRSRTFLGGMITGIVGSLATAPLVARVLFPHLTARIRRRFGSLLQPPLATKLQLERYEKDPGPDDGHIGYSTDEMADVVLRLLQDMGLTKTEDFSRLFVVCGHGSSSLNNPHESAYCCGACAGKRGGPNARAFAQMANDWRVRAKVSALGIAIPDDTMFVGAYHNTCDDSVVFYDLDRLPASHREDFEAARESIEEARRRNAHERCRRFDSAPLSISPRDALRHVEARAQDISQARPEYNHATNALCLVGRRAWSRGLFLDRRAFLTSYDPSQDDDEHSILQRILAAAIPVCAGINLEYYFSCVDYTAYGSGSKLPHNIVSLLGVMEGTSSDLRTGLYQQMVEIHEPLRITFLIESTPSAMLAVMERNTSIDQLVRGAWGHLAVIDPSTSQIEVFNGEGFHPYETSSTKLPQVDSSLECYQGSREHLPFFSIREARGAQ